MIEVLTFVTEYVVLSGLHQWRIHLFFFSLSFLTYDESMRALLSL